MKKKQPLEAVIIQAKSSGVRSTPVRDLIDFIRDTENPTSDNFNPILEPAEEWSPEEIAAHEDRVAIWKQRGGTVKVVVAAPTPKVKEKKPAKINTEPSPFQLDILEWVKGSLVGEMSTTQIAKHFGKPVAAVNSPLSSLLTMGKLTNRKTESGILWKFLS